MKNYLYSQNEIYKQKVFTQCEQKNTKREHTPRGEKMNIRKKIIKILLNTDEEIITTERRTELESYEKTYNQETKEEKTKKKSERNIRFNHAPIVWGDDPRHGVIKKRDDGYWAYFYDGDEPAQKKGDFEELKEKLINFRKEGCTKKSFQKHMNIKTNLHRYISRKGNLFQIFKHKKGKTMYFGLFSSVEKAREVRDFLISKDWDEQYLPRHVCSKKKLKVDEYYLAMRPHLFKQVMEEKRK